MHGLRITAALAIGLCALPAIGQDEPETRRPGLRVGADIFFGISNLAGPTRRITDRQWAAVETFEPSVVYLAWTGPAADEARLSFGVGDAYTGSDRITKQPVECLWSRQANGTTLTLGKHYVPFGQQEWEYETRWGGMAQTELGDTGVALSVTHNPDTHAVNSTLRVSRKIGEKAELGLSAASGRGWTYSTSHASGYALDALVTAGGITLMGEALIAEGRQGRYTFAFLKAQTEVRPGWRPYVGGYYGHDQAEEMGDLRSGVIGVEIDAAPHLMIEPGVGRASGRNVWWLTARATF